MKVKVSLAKKTDDSYEILIQNGLSGRLAKQIAKGNYGNSYCIITDSNVAKVFGKKLLNQFRRLKVRAKLISFPAGEKSKNLKTVENVLDEMLELGFDRKSCVVAVGGGVAGDLGGFAAAIYLRGVNFVHVPTTFLAMVDSSVGGKTGVNLRHGKNSAGTLQQPKKVYICPELLKGLPENEVRNGLSEVVKHAIIDDKEFFSFLERSIEKIMKLDESTLEKVIKRNCELKARVVERDEKESNYRAIVNYGHTIGHALEVLGNYRELKHGEAIAIGMVAEARMSNELGHMKEKEVEKIIQLLHKIGLPVSLPKGEKYSSARILGAARKDKKALKGKARYSLPKSIGKMLSMKGIFALEVSDSVVAKALEESR